jgi:3-hydroxyisobutyrate dehydrogenase-like beta-hydroxyacid dehydrogenase
VSFIETLEEAMSMVDVVVSICPPEAALDVARDVQETGYEGIYVDGNAVSPQTAVAIGELFGNRFVDGGIVGPPARRSGTTRFYLSGALANDVVGLFVDTLVTAQVISGGAGSASALKMCYAAYTKGSSALVMAVRALAESNGVTEALLAEWDLSQKGLRDSSERTALGTSPKAWRFEGEMLEIASTFDAAGLPAGFHRAAAEIYERMAHFKNEDPASLDQVIETLLDKR